MTAPKKANPRYNVISIRLNDEELAVFKAKVQGTAQAYGRAKLLA